jgi:hypothetical protein
VRRVHIPKGSGAETRPIGIPTFEDKVLQRAVAMVLEAVYEQEFLDCSYGFRPSRSAHQALQALWVEATKMGGGWVLEVDIRKFFDTLDHGHLREILRRRVLDGVLLRLIGKWLNAGVLEDGGITYPGAGSPQGGVVSPIEFRRPDKRDPPDGGPPRQPGTFDLLGFTHFWGKSRTGKWVVKRSTAKDRFRRALARVAAWCRWHRHDDVREQQLALASRLRGHYGYYGITGNSRALSRFWHEVQGVWRKWLNRRSQNAGMTWERMQRLMKRYPLPTPRIVHSAMARAANP